MNDEQWLRAILDDPHEETVLLATLIVAQFQPTASGDAVRAGG